MIFKSDIPQLSGRFRANKRSEMKLYTAEQMANILQVSKQTIWKYGRTGELETLRVGTRVRFIMPKIGAKNVEQRTERESNF